MRVRIHRGAHEIGGSCVELEHDGERIVLDLGLPLHADLDDPIALPGIAGLAEPDASLLGVLITHGHPDHWGLLPQLTDRVPIYIGETTVRILSEALFFTHMGIALSPAGYLQHRRTLALGPFSITPFPLDHSALDACALLVEAGGKRLLYSGDLRAHGARAELTERFIADPPRDVDALLLEGTHVRPRNAPARNAQTTEEDVEDMAIDVMRETKGIVLAAYSPQNVDRMNTLREAASSAGRTFVLDLYAASIDAAVYPRDENDPPEPGVLVYVPDPQRAKVKRTQSYDRVDHLGSARIFPEQFADRAGELVLTFRASMIRELERADCLRDAACLWSMWAGYLDDTRRFDLRYWLEARGIPLTIAHASGHAPVADLQRFALAVDARRIVPIHTSAPERYSQLFANVEPHRDGEWWEV